MAQTKLFSNVTIFLLISCVAISAIFLTFQYFNISIFDNYTTITFFKQQEAPHQQDEPTNISHIVFGISASLKTWPTRHHYIDLWWQPNVTRGFLWLDHEPYQNDAWPETSPPYKVSGDTSSFKYTGGPVELRHQLRMSRVVKESFELGLENVRWFVMGDDDTVFFPENLVSVLSKYDHNEMYYIGGHSESVEQNVWFSYKMAYGGSGVAISYPLAMVLAKGFDDCIERYAHLLVSDERIKCCASEIGIHLTQELGFHQVDLHGNLYGFLAAHPISPLVSLHHLDFTDPLFPTLNQVDSITKLVASYKMDPGRILQKSFCYDLRKKWSISISWGYSVELYPSLVSVKDMETAFQSMKTWTLHDGPFMFNTRPMSNDLCQKPLIYYVDQLHRVSEGSTRSRYKRYDAVLGEVCNAEEYASALNISYIDILTYQFHMWVKAPRRQCCEVMDDGGDGMKNVQVKIRECQLFESVTPQ